MSGYLRRKAEKRCAEWLAFCLSLGWKKSDLDALQALWWKYRDENGNLKAPDSPTPATEGE